MRLSKPMLAALERDKILGIRAGADHRFLGVWMVVVDGRAYVRTWNDKPAGWFRAFLEEPHGSIQLLSGREVRVKATRVRGARLLDAIDRAYAEKYNTKASQKWVRGFATPKRRIKTLELTPRSRGS